jgi:hypothetical protein
MDTYQNAKTTAAVLRAYRNGDKMKDADLLVAIEHLKTTVAHLYPLGDRYVLQATDLNRVEIALEGFAQARGIL